MTQIDLTGLVRPHLAEVTHRPEDANVAEFRLQPLERGFGHTLGNAMRRMLLSSLRGAAVWGFRIDGVLHEHQTIAGVVEDVHQVIGNLRALTLSLDEGVDEAMVTITRRGAGAVSAAEIGDQGGVRVGDGTQHLLTLQDDRELTIELYVNRGRGYVEADQHHLPKGMPVDLIRIDSIYNPVRRANFTVAETRVGQRTDYDRLTLTVETNGTVSPEEAVSYAAALAQTHFQYFASFGSHTAASALGGGDAGTPDSERLALLLRTSVDDIDGLSVRSVNSLKNANVRTLGELVKKTESDVMGFHNFGKKSLEEIAHMLEAQNLKFGMRYEEIGDAVRVSDWGTPPARVAAAAAARVEDDGEE